MMRDKKGIHVLWQAIGGCPLWVKVVGVIVVLEIAGTIVALSLGSPEVGILAFQAAITTVLVGVTYSYAKSARDTAQHTASLAEATRDFAQSSAEQLSYFKLEKNVEERTILEGLLEELKGALSGEPHFGMARWWNAGPRLKAVTTMEAYSIRRIADCYALLDEANERWPELKTAATAPVGPPERAPALREFQNYKKHVRSTVNAAVRIIEERLRSQ